MRPQPPLPTRIADLLRSAGAAAAAGTTRAIQNHCAALQKRLPGATAALVALVLLSACTPRAVLNSPFANSARGAAELACRRNTHLQSSQCWWLLNQTEMTATRAADSALARRRTARH